MQLNITFATYILGILPGDKTSSQLGLNAAELHGQAFLLAANIVTCRWNSKCDKGRCSTLQCMPQADGICKQWPVPLLPSDGRTVDSQQAVEQIYTAHSAVISLYEM
ncbi:hypothetical protein D917_00131 [Trichinella nativa]|uniref:Uncharacterized protein n=1 Tax=Trichinella nativa TaxID=6335 RepID=A0A1Y3EPC7_9BILA|nr:hypothetical protein D917_00131 [Trichinella nativa]